MRAWLSEILSALSCLLNAACGGPRECTFSAWSHELVERGSAWGPVRERLVDALPWNGPGHCLGAWRSHGVRGLLRAVALEAEGIGA